VRRTTVRIALFILAAVVALSVAEVTSEGFRDFAQKHPLIATFVAEAVLLAGVYLVIDEIIQRRDTRRWSDVTSLGKRALWTRADEPSAVIRSTVAEFTRETSREPSDRPLTDDPGEYQAFVSDSAGELGDWLRSDDGRARSFAYSLRLGASRLEEAIVSWGPTLVEDPDSAALINLLPDIVDAARSAADSIAPRAERSRRQVAAVDEADGWTDDDRRSFADDLLVVLKCADEFAARA
jgi:hypothetical protein